MRNFLIFALAATFLFSGCNSDEPKPIEVGVDVHFLHLVNGGPVMYDQLIYKNALNQDFSIKTIKYFISDLTFHKADGSEIKFDDIFYVDPRSGASQFNLSGRIPAGDYAGISFVHGLAPENNITGSLGLELDQLMEWPVMMGGGYHYMKLEGEYQTATEQSYFNFHAGALDGTPYEVQVNLSNQPFTVGQYDIGLEITMEIQNWFTNPVDWDFTYFGAAVMGNAEAQQTIQQNGHDVYSFKVGTLE